jgi:DNA-binding beta-propeller fold protein YncE
MGTAIEVHPLNGNLYVAVEDQVSVIKPDTLEQLNAFLISSWSHPGPIRISPDGVWGIAAGRTDDGSDITIFNAEQNGVIGYYHFPAATSVAIEGIAFSPLGNPVYIGDAFVASYDFSNETVTTLTVPFKEAGVRVLIVPQSSGFGLFASNLSDTEETVCANLVEVNPSDGTVKRALFGDMAFGKIVYKKPY